MKPSISKKYLWLISCTRTCARVNLIFEEFEEGPDSGKCRDEPDGLKIRAEMRAKHKSNSGMHCGLV